MSQYIHFTEEQKEQARHTDIADMLIRKGETLKRSGSEYEWRDGYQKVTIRENLWFNQYERVGGNTIDFVMRYFNKTYPEAVEMKKRYQDGNLTAENIIENLSREKANQRETIKIPTEKLRKYALNADAKQLEDFILKACDHYRKYLIRQRNRDER